MASVFISYTHDSDAHRDRVRLLAEELKRDLAGIGIDVVTDHDLPPGGPNNDFRRWSEQHAERSDLVIPVFNDTYRKCWDGEHPPGVRNGGTNEATVIASRVNIAGGSLPFIRAVIFDEADKASIPFRLVDMQWFLQSRDYQAMVAWVKLAVSGLTIAAPLAPTPTAITWPARCATFVPDMANRDAEFTFFADTLCGSAPQRATLISADRDHGKTKLVAEFYRYGCEVLGQDACAFIDFKGRSTVDHIWDTLSLDLGSRLPGLSDRSPGKLRESLRRATVPVLLCFDTFEQGTEEARDFVQKHLLADLGRTNAMRLLIAGQPQAMPDPKKAAWEAHARRYDLGNIPDPQPWVEWAGRVYPLIPENSVRTIVACSGGVPGVIANQLAHLGSLSAVQLAALGLK